MAVLVDHHRGGIGLRSARANEGPALRAAPGVGKGGEARLDAGEQLHGQAGEGERLPAARTGWAEPDPEKHAVLSSGGKDSLLSYGLLAEAGRDVHPVFVNESGRHWFTALNAYRHFSTEEKNTARVWTDVERQMIRLDLKKSKSELFEFNEETSQ